MSFGYGIGDIIAVSQLAWKAVQNTREACGQHDELTRDVASLHSVLDRLKAEAIKPESLLQEIQDIEKQELEHIVNGCTQVLKTLNGILEKYSSLSEEKRSMTKLWQRVRFGNGEMQDLSKIRMQIASQSASLALFLHLISLGSQGRVERYMAQQIGALQEIQQTIHDANGAVAAGNRESTLTTYENDDKGFWKDLRRELVAEGCSSEVMAKHKDAIMANIIELTLRGAWNARDGLEYEQNGTTHQSSAVTPTVLDTNRPRPDSIDNNGIIGAMDFSFDFKDEAVKSQIYTRVMASASVRNSIQYLSDHPAPGRDSQDSPVVASNQRRELVLSSPNALSTSRSQRDILEAEDPRGPLPEADSSSLGMENSPDENLPLAVAGSQDMESNRIQAEVGLVVDTKEESNSTSRQRETREGAQENSVSAPLQQQARRAIERSSPGFSKPLPAVLPQSGEDDLETRHLQASKQRKPSESIARVGNAKFTGARPYKVAVMGAPGSDVSSMTIQLIQHHFLHEYDPTIEDSYRKYCVIDDQEAILEVADIPIHVEYPFLREQYMREREGFMILYSITSRSTFDEISTFRDQLLKVKDKDYFPMIIVGNHCDREAERQVSRQEGYALARSIGCPFIEASSRAEPRRINVENSFHELVREIRRYEKADYGVGATSPPRGSLREFLQRGRRFR